MSDHRTSAPTGTISDGRAASPNADADAGGGGFRVHPITQGPHANTPEFTALSTPPRPSPPPCAACGATGEVWVCLACGAVGCSRYIEGHGAAHAAAAGHPLALSLADMSVWCYGCEAYLDVFNMRALHGVFALLYEDKFGEPPALPAVLTLLPSSSAAADGGR